ncbi:MAG: phosphate acyltransferase PlsX [Lachnospiraceae bacterium]|nr:phosphate acyltransferase PlsX [Lachnospiraceae bacterium]
MNNNTVVVVDAMGGDNAPGEIVKGAVDAVNKNDKVEVILTGIEDQVRAELEKYTYPKERISIKHASEVITTEETPVFAIKKKKDSSIVVGQKLLKTGEADAFVSAGSTGALLVGGTLVAGRIRGIERTPIGTLIPTKTGVALLVDSGANVDCRPSHLVQFAQMGSIYMEHVVGVKNPRVSIVNIGVEEEKGNALVKETFPLLKECSSIHFTGSIEAREIPHGGADVIVCDGFTGNVILKLYEGTGAVLLSMIKQSMMSSLRSKIGALLIKPALKGTLKKFDASQYGGAPMLGLNGLVVKTHGSATAKEVCTSILQCITFKEQGINDKIKALLGRDVAKKKAEKAETAEGSAKEEKREEADN